jgi:hypothetical protein
MRHRLAILVPLDVDKTPNLQPPLLRALAQKLEVMRLTHGRAAYHSRRPPDIVMASAT